MGTVSPLRQRTEPRVPRERGRIRPATLRVSIDVGLPDAPGEAIASIHVRVSGAKAPIRLYLYVDGDLADAWAETDAVYELRAGEILAGRHAVTARAVDAQGRWAGASAVIDTDAEPLLLAQ